MAMVGTEWNYPGWSCEEIASLKPEAGSDWYWIQPNRNSSPVLVYCELSSLQSGSSPKRGWTRVLHVNMSDPLQQCPGHDIYPITQDQLRLCGRFEGDCESMYSTVTGFTYRRVCGRVTGYAKGSPDGFITALLDLDDAYVNGFSITYGEVFYRKHVWSFAMYTQGTCGRPYKFTHVGKNYYCEKPMHKATNQIYTRDPLFAGRQFCVELLEPTNEPLEFRICGHQKVSDGKSDEDALLHYLALYIQ